eukprot:gene1149-1314_t
MASDINYTILRPPFFMNNFSNGFLRKEVDSGCITTPCGEHAVSFISTQDVGECIAVTLLDDKLNGQTIEITGPAPLNFQQCSDLISKQLGTLIHYIQAKDTDFYSAVKDSGMPNSSVKVLNNLYDTVNQDKNSKVTLGVEQITGHKPMSFEQFVKASFTKNSIEPSQ